MARKPINPDIGEIQCPFTGETAPLRKDKAGKFYFLSSAGMIKPNLSAGQDWILEHGIVWGANKPVNEPEEPPQIKPTTVENSPPVPVNESSSEKQPVTAPSTQPKPKKKGFFEILIG